MSKKKSIKPKVSIVSVSYNQEKYIAQALESFIAQQTNFAFEVIIADDCSSDRTPEIITQYAQAYPDIIKPILRPKNIGVLQNFVQTLRQAKGDYIALCEGDDYWTDPHKLQIQVDFLDKHPDYALCFHPGRVFFEDNPAEESIYPDVNNRHSFNLTELLKRNFIQTNSVMYRRQSYDAMPENILPIDWYLHLYHAQFGKIGFINKVMSAYRRHPGGVWWESDHNLAEVWKKHGIEHLGLYVAIFKLYGDKPAHKKIIFNLLSQILSEFLEVDAKHKTTLISEALAIFPDIIEKTAAHQRQELVLQESLLEEKEHEIQHLRQVVREKSELLDHRNHEIRTIKASRFWKLRNTVARLVGKKVV